MEKEEILIKNELDSELTGLNKGESKQKKIIYIIGIICFLILALTIIIIVISSSRNNTINDNNNKSLTIIGTINCIYDIKTIMNTTILLSNEYKKESNINIEISGKIIKYSKEYKFENTGNTLVKYLIYEPIMMDYMFKGVPDIISIECIPIIFAK